ACLLRGCEVLQRCERAARLVRRADLLAELHLQRDAVAEGLLDRATGRGDAGGGEVVLEVQAQVGQRAHVAPERLVRGQLPLLELLVVRRQRGAARLRALLQVGVADARRVLAPAV